MAAKRGMEANGVDLSGWVARPLGGAPSGWHALSAAKGVVCSGRARLILNFASTESNLSFVASPVKKPHGIDLSDLPATKLGNKRFPAKRAARKV